MGNWDALGEITINFHKADAGKEQPQNPTFA